MDGAGPHWRGAVNDPGTTFTSDAYPNQGGVVIYQVAVKDASNTEIDRATCTDNTGGGGNSVVCSWGDTGTDFDVTWDLYAGADKYVIYRTVDGAGPHWRGAVNDPGTTFTSDAYPNQGGVVIYEVAVKDASNTEIDRATCTDADAEVVCTSLLMTDGTHVVGLASEVSGAANYRIDRTDTPGTWVSQGNLDLDTGEHLDAAIGGSPIYRAVALDGAGTELETHECVNTPYSNGSDTAVYDLPTAASGAVGGTGSAVPAVLLYAAPAVPGTAASTTSTGAEDLCSSAGLYQNLPAPVGTQAWVSLQVPAGGRVQVDLVNKKDIIETGNWGGRINLYERNSDGTHGTWMGSKLILPSYHWNSLKQRVDNLVVASNWTGADGEFLLQTNVEVVNGIGPHEGAAFYVTNVRIIDANDNLLSRPCDSEDVNNCIAAGGTHYFPEAVTIDNTTYERGCYVYEGCTADLPSVAGILDSLAEWSCENDQFLNPFAADEDYGALIGDNVTVVAPVPSLAAAGFAPSGAAYAGPLTVGGAATVPVVVVVGGGLVVGGVIGYVAFELLVDDPANIEEQNGVLIVTGTTAVDQILINTNTDTYLDNRTSSPDEREQVNNELRRAAALCLAEMTTDLATSVITAWVAPNHVVQDQLTGEQTYLVKFDGDWHHVCEFIPTYIPGAGTHANGRPMREATIHMAQVIYNTEGVDEATYPGMPSATNPTLPQPGWVVQNRQQPRNPAWVNDPPYNCKGVKPQSACDEFPARSTTQGGAPGPGETQPHLSIIDWNHNSRQGSDLGSSFYNRCNVTNGNLFLVIPTLPARLGAVTELDPVPEASRSHFRCEGYNG